MPTVAQPTTSPKPTEVGGDSAMVYQLRVVINGISPLIWRRLLVPAQTTIAQLHTILQTAFGWTDSHLHRFVIHGTEYGIYQVGGPWFRDDARQVRLGELGLRLGEKFTYTYNYFAAWTCELRVEQIAHTQPGRSYPYCVGGRRAGPPEEWEGPWAFVERTQPYLVFEAMLRAAEIVGQLLDADEDDELATVIGAAERDELASLLPLLGLEQFDRRACNTALATCVDTAAGGSRV
jgi:Plasmid pRiA4b ORF-3-like protein